jgi:hypothetical protein
LDSKEALQKQLNATKGSGSSAGGSDQSVLSLMMQLEDHRSKVLMSRCMVASAGF